MAAFTRPFGQIALRVPGDDGDASQEIVMRLGSSKKSAVAEIVTSLGHSPSPSGEFLVVAAGGCAMLLVVALFDLFGLFPS
jgi:hypothetical protein